MGLLIFYAAISIFFSFLCSILEAVLLSVTPTFLNVKKKEGKAFATTLEKLKKDVDRPLIAILTLNTIAHTVGAILVGKQAEKLYGNGDNYGVFIISALMTFLILVASEIIPKTIGATYWKQLANFTSKVLIILIFPLKWTGILWLLQLATKLIGNKGHHGSVLSREDFHVMTDIAHEEGVFEEAESKVIKNLLNFKKIQVKDIMTPRTVLKIASEDQNIKDFFDENKNLRFSRIPIYKDNTDNITGYILKDDVYKDLAEGKDTKTLADLKRKILVVHRNVPIPNLFEKLIQEKEHISLVVDEYGSISGLVTMEDVIETLLGLEIMDESDTDSDMQQLARKNWEKRAKRMGIIEGDS
ncbi:MAG TPA: HlyC/CorC family transporter [Flavobacteriia bacterium]|jgi:CBS domain containing-hemolysin-like protein|nr:HlyC/CorC family transporter [Flavobacteriia bacterium]